MRSLHDDSASIGSAPRRASASRPTASTPPECPRPHRNPARQARPRPPVSGATAARWSGPERTWMRPAVSPASVAASIAGIVSRVATRTGPWPRATIWPGQHPRRDEPEQHRQVQTHGGDIHEGIARGERLDVERERPG